MKFDDDRFYSRYQELIRVHMGRIAFGSSKTAPATVIGCRNSYHDMEGEEKAQAYSMAYTGLMRFFLIYVLQWTEEEAIEHQDEVFGIYGFKNVADKGFISIPLMTLDGKETKMFRLDDREDIIKWVYNVNNPSGLIAILEKKLEENRRKDTKRLLDFNISRMKRYRCHH